MMRPPSPTIASSPTGGPSLERRLPLLVLALVACVVAGFSVAGYREVRTATVTRTIERLEGVARELTTSSARIGDARVGVLRALAADPAITQAVVGSGASASLAARIAAAHQPGDSTRLGWELWTVAGERRFRSGVAPSPRDSAVLAATRARVADTDSVQRSPLYGVADGVGVWTAVPVRVAGRTVGVLAEQRRLGRSPRTEETIRQLIGPDVRVLYTSRGSSEWASLAGTPAAAPFARPATEDSAVLVEGARGSRYYAVQANVPRTPWLIVLLQPESTVLRRPQQFLRHLLGVGALLLAVATLGAWLLSRHVTRPLRRITDASAALAGGDYAQRVAVKGGAELAGLATTFNAMAAQLGDAHATLAERNAALLRANEAKVEFLAMMSHELRTPLNAIAGYTELMTLGLRGPVTPEQVEDLERIRRNKDHLVSIIADILNFSRADAGALRLAITRVPLAAVVSDAVDALGHQFAAKGVRLTVNPVPDDSIVRGDREKVQQVLLNVLSNALSFTEADGEVVITTVAIDQAVRVDVRDTGIGIPAERLDDIFEPFVQVDSSRTRRVGGTGLGLAIARTLTSAMGGSLAVVSAVGVGSTFSLTLPRANVAESALPDANATQQARTYGR